MNEIYKWRISDWMNDWSTDWLNEWIEQMNEMNEWMECNGMEWNVTEWHEMKQNQMTWNEMNEWMNEQTNEWTDKRLNEWINPRTNQWINERRNQWTNYFFVELPIPYAKFSPRWTPLSHFFAEPALHWATSLRYLFSQLPLIWATSLTRLCSDLPQLLLWANFCNPILPLAQPLQSVSGESCSITNTFWPAAVPMRFVTSSCNPARHGCSNKWTPFRTWNRRRTNPALVQAREILTFWTSRTLTGVSTTFFGPHLPKVVSTLQFFQHFFVKLSSHYSLVRFLLTALPDLRKHRPSLGEPSCRIIPVKTWWSRTSIVSHFHVQIHTLLECRSDLLLQLPTTWYDVVDMMMWKAAMAIRPQVGNLLLQ